MKVVIYSKKTGVRYDLSGVVCIETIVTLRRGREVHDYRFLFDDLSVRCFNVSSFVIRSIVK